MIIEQLQCIQCQDSYAIDTIVYRCRCGGLLAVHRDPDYFKGLSTKKFDERRLSNQPVDISGVWRFREGLTVLDPDSLITHPEGHTRLYRRKALENWLGVSKLYLKHEGENPTGSFKDRGMAVAVTQAKHLGAKILACASTGNTSASLAAYAATAGLQALVLLPEDKVAKGKLAQAIAYGAKCVAIKGDFDRAMVLVQSLAEQGLVYLVNSLNPFRIEGQKTIIWELLQNLNWQAPDWILVPGGNLGNTSAFGKAIDEAYQGGWISKKPRLATIQAEGASPFFRSFKNDFNDLQAVKASTIATAIQIGNPVNYPKARNAIENLRGVVAAVSDQEILAAKAQIDLSGIGCEPASACSLAGVRKLVATEVIKTDEVVVGILTGHFLKDTDSVLYGEYPAIIKIDSEQKLKDLIR